MKYEQETPRITINFINNNNEEELFEIERNWTNVGEVFTNHMTTLLMQQQYKNKKPPKQIIVMTAKVFNLIED